MRIVRYPAAEASSDGRTTLVFDGQPVLFQEERGVLTLQMELPPLPNDADKHHEMLLNLMSYAMGRSMKDDAILSYDTKNKTFLLWQTLKGVISDETLVSTVETFLATGEWWRQRLQAKQMTASSQPQTMFFRP
ncbi:MAG: CesT family type III secretion system chaperone [Lentisphaeria bacterium]|nr:CesT family type III secretion system chaperone [Lentisphaeria bacterium]